MKTYGGKNKIWHTNVDEPEEIELKPRVHYFRSSNIKSVANELEKNWVDNNICIPMHEKNYK